MFDLLILVPFFSLQVSWVRRRGDQLHLISFGDTVYSSDSRYSLKFTPPSDWQLHIQFSNERDEGQFECQINTQPTLVLVVYLTVVGKWSGKLSTDNILYSCMWHRYQGWELHFDPTCPHMTLFDPMCPCLTLLVPVWPRKSLYDPRFQGH